MKILVITVINIINFSLYANSSVITLKCKQSPKEVVTQFKSLLEKKGLIVMATVNHTKNAKSVGLKLDATHLIIFGNPKLGTKLMQSNPLIGLDLPMKALAYKNAGQTFLAYTTPDSLAKKYDIKDRPKLFNKMSKALKKFSQLACLKPKI
jgi:uncharacterized protein (DUF302 family)